MSRDQRRYPKLAAESPIWPAAAIAGAYFLLGLGMIAQPERFERNTPYANLLEILSIQVWGGIYLAVSVLFSVYLIVDQSRLVLSIIAHFTGFTLTGVWLIAFIVRYVTDPTTTISNIVAWLVYLLLLMRSVALAPVIVRSDNNR
jgi:hypothetical protein